jgi:hypothetical protein
VFVPCSLDESPLKVYPTDDSSFVIIWNKGETTDFVLPGFPRFSGFQLYSQNSHRTPRIFIVLKGFSPYFRYSEDSDCIHRLVSIFPGVLRNLEICGLSHLGEHL